MLRLLAGLYHRFHKDEKGQGMVEYGLIIALVAIGVIVVLGLLRDELTTTFNNIINSLKSAVSKNPTP
ncbi:MAG: Flp family type IVb pilin [Firmicutes bacterium]|nr:Flp family type IVb pilin [Bacillota bacterium]MCL5039719.1 Flp family type IVb pilin [Bacillota bacterium]